MRRWEDFNGYIDAEHAHLVRYAPYGDLDFISLPAPVTSFAQGPLGVMFQCADRGVYFLDGLAESVAYWRIQLLLKA